VNASLIDGITNYWSFDYTINNAYPSSTIYGLNATINGTVYITPGKVSNSANFTGSGFLNLTDTNYCNFGLSNLTINLWIYKWGGDITGFNDIILSNQYYTGSIYNGLAVDVYGGGSTNASDWNEWNSIGNVNAFSSNILPYTKIWYMITYVRTVNATSENMKFYLNGTQVYDTNASPINIGGSTMSCLIGRYSTINNFNAQNISYDELGIWNRSLSNAEITLLYNNGSGLSLYSSFYFSNINCTSCNIPYGSTTPPYATDDTTPTFQFLTAQPVACRISDQNISYDLMGSSRDCYYGQNQTNRTCTLTAQDALVDWNASIFIACTYNGFNDTLKLLMNITSLDTPNSTEAIQQGIENSVIWPGATVYTNQKVYLRSLNNSQKLATVDKVVVYGNQRWLINYENTTALGLFNLTPVVYSLDMKNMSIKAIRANVTAFIDSTKN
jgi:hypothetical protein